MPPFLRVNGVTIPVADGDASLSFTNVGDRFRSFSGQQLSNRRARKRTIRGTTTPQIEILAKAIEGILASTGDGWPFDFNIADVLPDIFSSKGAGAPTAFPTGSNVLGQGKRGNAATRGAFGNDSQFGTGSVTTEVATTNLLIENVRTGTNKLQDLTGFSVLFAAVATSSTEEALLGSRSLKCITDAVGEGVGIAAIAVGGSQTFTGSLYIKGISSGVDLVIEDDDGQSTTLSLTGLSISKWNLVQVTVTTGASATELFLDLKATTASTLTFFSDGWQMEQLAAPATSWVNGVRAAGDLGYPPGIISAFGDGDMTVNFWAKSTTANPGADRFLINIGSTSAPNANDFNIFRPSGANSIKWTTASEFGGGLDTITLTTVDSDPVWDDGSWRMFTCVLRRNPETGENEKSFYGDGVLEGSSNPAAELLKLSQIDKFHVANREGGSDRCTIDTLIDDLTIYPFAAPASVVADWFDYGDNGNSIATQPRVKVDGDIHPDDSILYDPNVTRSSYLAATPAAGTFRENLRAIEFMLDEV